MAKNAGLTYLGIKNEHIQVCPHCGSTAITKRLRRKLYLCRKCGERFQKFTNLQSWLMDRFNETHPKTILNNEEVSS